MTLLTLLDDPEWSQRYANNVEVAKLARVDERTVRNVRAELESQNRKSDSATGPQEDETALPRWPNTEVQP